MMTNGKLQTDILIVGGGVIGCSIAYYLRKADRDVLVVEQGAIGEQASSAAAGLLAPLGPLSGPGPFADLLLASFALFPSLVPELEDVSGLHLAYAQTGALRTVRNPKRVSALKKRMAAWQPLGLTMHWLTGDEARQLEPALSPAICAAIYAPEESQIAAPQVVRAFAKAARNRGARLHSHTRVTGIQQRKGRVTGITTDQGDTISCNHLIVATGAWAAFCGEWLGITLPVSPLRGQIILLRQPAVSLRQSIFGEAVYLVPKEGRILVGATKEEAGFDTQVTDEGVSWLRDTAIRLVPTLQQCPLESSWAGLRPRTPDTRPILGPVSQWENVTLAVGHNAVGILLSPITGQTIAETIVTDHVPQSIRPFSLQRFNAQAPSV